MRKIHLALLGITAINCAVMMGYSIPVLLREANGLWPFDIRITGYSVEEANAYLATITEDGKQFYLTTQQRLDTFFPALFAATLIFTLYRLAPKLPALFLTPLAGALFDYYENTAVAEMLTSGSLDEGLVEATSLLTTLKFASITLSLVTILWLWQKRRSNG